MKYEDFKVLYPDVPGSDLCPICTNRKCRFIYSEAEKDLPTGAVATRTHYKPCKPGKGGTGEDISKKTYMAVFDCPAFRYNPKRERKDPPPEESFKAIIKFDIG